MATDVIMPALGVAQEKGTLLNWFKSEGESVRKGEPLMEVETDKATVEIEAPASGVLTDVTASPGDEVPVGNKIAVILAPDEEAEPAAKRKLSHPSLLSEGQKIERGTPGGQSESRDEDRRETSTSALPAEPAPMSSHAGERIPASPAARRIARERGIDIASLKGSGPGGAVLAQDVLGSKARQVTAPAGPPSVKELVQLTPMRRLVGERMARSKQSAPHFYLSIEVDMAEITRQRNALKEREVPLAPSINDFILIACARALRQFPSLNAAFTEQGIQGYSDINIGMAVALEEGLVVPVIRNADRLSLAELAQQSRDLAEKAQNRKLFPLDYEGGTFTVSNLGMFGIDNFIAIINPPQCAILAVGQVAPRVVPHGEGIAVRPRMTMSLSADHRVVDGALAARFLQEIKRTLETGKF